MSVDPTIPVMLAQLSQTERLAHEAQTGPELARPAAQHATMEMLLHEQKQVQKADDAEHTSSVNARPQGRRSRQRPRRHLAPRKPPPEPQEDAPSDDDPWTGNIVNLKV